MTSQTETWAEVPVSKMVENTFNPIRAIVDTMKLTPHPDKPMISLSIGDPTVFGNLPMPEVCESALVSALKSKSFDGYGPSIGYEKSRQAVADYVSTPTSTVTAQDVVLTSGCSGALDLCISCLADPGDNILVPRPGFSLYKTLAQSLDISVKHYDLLPEKSWEIDLTHLDSLVDSKTRAIVVCNPSNPCGSVYTAAHLTQILALAHRHRLPIIADEIYEHFVFAGQTYHSMASLSDDVPILACGGLTKRYLVPGWRLGWIVINDRHGAFAQVRSGLTKLSQKLWGPNSLVQAALPAILRETTADFYTHTIHYVQKNAQLFKEEISKIPGLTPVVPQGAMYMMVAVDLHKFPDFPSDMKFTEALVTQQSVFCIPGTCFEYPGYFRVVLTVPTDKVREACHRLAEFCHQHYNHNSAKK